MPVQCAEGKLLRGTMEQVEQTTNNQIPPDGVIEHLENTNKTLKIVYFYLRNQTWKFEDQEWNIWNNK